MTNLQRAGARLPRLVGVLSTILSLFAGAWQCAPTLADALNSPAATNVSALPSGWHATTSTNFQRIAPRNLPATGPTPLSPPFYPVNIQGAYGFTSAGLGNTAGAGITVAIVEPYGDTNSSNTDVIQSDLQTFSTVTNLPYNGPTSANPTLVEAFPDGTPPTVDPSYPYWAVETSMNVEWVHAMAPGARILLVVVPNFGVDLFDGVVYARKNASVVTMGWGGAEFSGETAMDSDFTSPNVAFFASVGDAPGVVTYPAASPNVTAVGGTTLGIASGNVWSSETGWSGGGGGVSAFEPYASFQSPWVSSGGRQVPDVAADADPNTGVVVAQNGLGYQVGGTEVACALWAGMTAVLDSGRSSPISEADLNSRLYYLGNPTNQANNFHDITTGSNGFPAGPGYDLVTGLGSPMLNSLLSGFEGPSELPAVDVEANDPDPHAGESITLTATVTGVNLPYPNGTVDFSSGIGDSGPIVLQNGVARYTTPPLNAGSYTYNVNYSGDINYISNSNYAEVDVSQDFSSEYLFASMSPSVYDSTVTFTDLITTGYNLTGTVQFAVDGANVGGPVTLANTSASFTTSTLSVGTHTISTSYSGDANNTSDSASMTQVVNPVAHVHVMPSTATIPLNTPQQMTADVLDAALDEAPAVNVVFSLARGSVGSITPAGIFSSATPGTATVDAAVGSVVGTAALVVPDGPPTINSVTANPNPVTGKTTTLGVSVSDAAGSSAITGYSWTQVTGPVSCTLSSATAASPVATFTKTGTYVLAVVVANKGGFTSSGIVAVTVIPARNVKVTPSPATVSLGRTKSFVASLVDQFGAPISGAVIWSASGVGTIDPTGLYSAGSVPGTATVTAASGAAVGSALVTVPDGPPSVGPVIASPNPVKGTSTNLSAAVSDAAGPRAISYAWSQTSGPPCTLSSTTAVEPKATFTLSGTYGFALKVTNTSGLSAGGSGTVTVVSTPVNITVTPNPVTVTAGGAQPFTAAAVDQFGNADPGAPITWSIARGGAGSINSAGLYTASTVGVATVIAASGTVQGTAAVTVPDGPPSLTAVTATPSTVTGTTTALAEKVTDAAGPSALSYLWTLTSGPSGSKFSSATAASPTVTFTQTGTYVFGLTVTNKAGKTATGSVTVIVNPANKVTVSPPTATVALGAGQTFTVAVSNQFGPVVGPAVVWSVSGVGTIDQTGHYSAGAVPGNATITVTFGGVTATATVTVPDGPPTLTAVTSTPSTVTGTTSVMGETATDAAGLRTLTYQWYLDSGATVYANSSTIANPTFTYSQPGNYTFGLVITNGAGLTASGTVAVTVVSTPTTVVVSPSNPFVVEGGTQQFTASVLDQFGLPMTGQTVTWSVTGEGKISATGLFTAAGTGGNATITATVGRTVSGSTGVTSSG